MAAAADLSLGLASAVPMLFLSQLPMAFMHAMHAAQAFISDMSSDESRVRAAAAHRPFVAFTVRL